jgi:maleylpyruvate isomerase
VGRVTAVSYGAFVDVDALVRGCNAAQAALVDGVRGLTNDVARQPSLLPGWSVGHVLTHLARNADAHRGLAEAALRGESSDMYPRGLDARNADIEAGAGRPAAALVDDVARSGEALAAAWSRLPASAWDADGRRALVQPWPNRDLPFLRWREVALHALDLGIGVDVMSDEYVDHELLRLLTTFVLRIPERIAVRIEPSDAPWRTIVVRAGDAEAGSTVTFDGTRRDLLAWMTGRHAGPLAVAPLEGLV